MRQCKKIPILAVTKKFLKMIKDIVFDFGGVLIEIDTANALKKFNSLGLKNPERYLNSYKQEGLFYALENGDINADEFVRELSKLCNRELTYNDAFEGWMGFVVKVQNEYLQWLQSLRPHYRLSILSNTNPFLQGWARSRSFTADGKSLDDLFDQLFLSYLMRCSKPNDKIYLKMLRDGNMRPEETLFVDDGAKNIEAARNLGINVLQVKNGEDWRPALTKFLEEHK